MSEQGYEQLTLFPEDFHANPSPWLESKKVKGTTVTCGRKCSELSPSLRRIGLSVRMYLESCELPLPTLSRIWSVQAITSSCLILKLRLSAHVTGENGSRLWPTATVNGNYQAPKEGTARGTGLATAVRLWPTVTVEDAARSGSAEAWQQYEQKGKTTQYRLRNAVAMWPTPKASDGKGSGPIGSKSAEHDLERGNLRGAVLYATPQHRDYRSGQHKRWEDPNRTRNLNDQIGGQLNPTWVEWLMGFPLGWTDLNA